MSGIQWDSPYFFQRQKYIHRFFHNFISVFICFGFGNKIVHIKFPFAFLKRNAVSRILEVDIFQGLNFSNGKNQFPKSLSDCSTDANDLSSKYR